MPFFPLQGFIKLLRRTFLVNKLPACIPPPHPMSNLQHKAKAGQVKQDSHRTCSMNTIPQPAEASHLSQHTPLLTLYSSSNRMN